jgi:hypothetical protein
LTGSDGLSLAGSLYIAFIAAMRWSKGFFMVVVVWIHSKLFEIICAFFKLSTFQRKYPLFIRYLAGCAGNGISFVSGRVGMLKLQADL